MLGGCGISHARPRASQRPSSAFVLCLLAPWLSTRSVPVMTARYVLQGDETPATSQRDGKLTCIYAFHPIFTADERLKVLLDKLVRVSYF
jgi:hypothetical protein